jgi:hypothetical protein
MTKRLRGASRDAFGRGDRRRDRRALLGVERSDESELRAAQGVDVCGEAAITADLGGHGPTDTPFVGRWDRAGEGADIGQLPSRNVTLRKNDIPLPRIEDEFECQLWLRP